MVDTNYGRIHLNVKTETDEFNLYGKPCNLSAFSHVPIGRDLPRERNVFNSPKEVVTMATPKILFFKFLDTRKVFRL